MAKERNTTIDFLRGLCMLGVVVVHCLSYYLGNETVFYVWDYLHYEVPIFIFCSAYLFYKKSLEHKDAEHISVGYVVKRFKRLYVPYAVFLAAYTAFVFILQPNRLTPDYFFKTITLTGGIDINWLVVLFLQMSLIFPFIDYLYKKQKLALYAFIALSVSSTIYFFFASVPLTWKITMALPWSIMPLFTIFYIRNENKPKVLTLAFITSALICAFFFALQYILKDSIKLYNHKYPPDIMLLTYGITAIGVWSVVAKTWIAQKTMSFWNFMSINSYPIFFTHYIAIYVANTAFQLNKKVDAVPYTLIILGATILLQIAVNRVSSRFSS